MNNQRFTSAGTSVNHVKLPALYKRVNFPAMNDGYGIAVCDYGCGKFTTHLEKFIEDSVPGSIWYGYDPYNRGAYENRRTLEYLQEEDLTNCILCSNVLNVIDSIQEVVNIIQWIEAYSCHNGNIPFFFSVYEGDKSGEGKQTGKDQYQRNERIKEYLQYFFSKVSIKHGVITNRPDLVL